MGKSRALRAKARDKADEKRGDPSSLEPSSGAGGPVLHPDGRRTRLGLVNLGNTCYMNSILQCLNVSLPFSDEFLGLASEGLGELSGPLCTALRGIRGMEPLRGPAIAGFNPRLLFNQVNEQFPWFAGGRQQDAHDFLRTLLGAISEEKTAVESVMEEELSSESRPVGRCEGCIQTSFGGQLCVAVLCWSCGQVSLRVDPFLDFSLEIPAPGRCRVGPLGVVRPGRIGASARDGEEACSDSDGEFGVDLRGRRKAKLAPQAPKAAHTPIGVWGRAAVAEAKQQHLEAARLVVQAIVLRSLANMRLRERGDLALVGEDGIGSENAKLEEDVDQAQAAQRPMELDDGAEEPEKVFRRRASHCYGGLSTALRGLFGPEDAARRDSADSVKLEDCFRLFTAVEAIHEDFEPSYQCLGCEANGSGRSLASKRAWISPDGLPRLLSVQLKRFRYRSDHFDKAKTSIRSQLLIDLSDFVLTTAALDGLRPRLLPTSAPVGQSGGVSTRPLVYELYGICEHQGTTLESGHYVAYVNSGPSLAGEQWFCISDNKVRGCGRSEVLEAEAYIAFYRRQGE